MRTLVRPGGATSVLGGPAETAADVAGAVRALLGVGPSVRPSWGPSVVVVVVIAAVASARRSTRHSGRILALFLCYYGGRRIADSRVSQGCELSRGASGRHSSLGEVVRAQHNAFTVVGRGRPSGL